jgi:hypothetical protein
MDAPVNSKEKVAFFIEVTRTPEGLVQFGASVELVQPIQAPGGLYVMRGSLPATSTLRVPGVVGGATLEVVGGATLEVMGSSTV